MRLYARSLEKIMATKPFTVRLSPHVERWIEHEAKRSTTSKGALLDALADEAIRLRQFPGIGFMGEGADRRAFLIGTGWDVWEIIDQIERITRAGMLAAHDLTERQLDLAHAYYLAYPGEIDLAVQENRQPPEYWMEKYPSVFARTGNL